MPNRRIASTLDNYMTVQEIAARLGRSERTILWQTVHGHFLGARKFGEGKRGIWLIPQTALKCYSPPKKGRPAKVAGDSK
jgi:hypothetical protein